MKTRLTYFLFAFLILGAISSCSVEEDPIFPTYSTGDEIDEPAEPDGA